MDPALRKRLLAHLSGYVSEHKRARVDEVLAHRTRYLTVVLENLQQSHNTSAVLRCCDCFGIQDLHVIEGDGAFRVNEAVAVGSGKWVTVHRHRAPTGGGTGDCLAQLRGRGYRIAGLTLREPSVPIHGVPLDSPLALCFGAEEEGLSESAHAAADLFVNIPMVGFTQSLNVSVTAAVALYELTPRLRRSAADWRLSEEEKEELRLAWYRRVVPRAEAHVERVRREG